jgi:hypothetical protein
VVYLMRRAGLCKSRTGQCVGRASTDHRERSVRGSERVSTKGFSCDVEESRACRPAIPECVDELGSCVVGLAPVLPLSVLCLRTQFGGATVKGGDGSATPWDC